MKSRESAALPFSTKQPKVAVSPASSGGHNKDIKVSMELTVDRIYTMCHRRVYISLQPLTTTG